jgi:hypothetical protein
MKKVFFLFGSLFMIIFIISACSHNNRNVDGEDFKAERHPIGVTFHFDQIDNATPSEPKYQYTFILKNTSSETYNLQFEEDLKYSYDFILEDESKTILTTTGTNVWNKVKNENSFLLEKEEELILTKGSIGDIMPSGKYLVDFNLYLLNEQLSMKFDFEVE